MKTRILFAVLFTLTVYTGYTQNTEERNIDSFDKISVFGNIQVFLTKGDVGTVKINSMEVNPSEVVTEVKDKLLKIRMKSNLFDDVTVRVYLNFDELRELSSNAAAEVVIKERIKADKIIVTATSGGRVKLDAELNAVELKSYQGGHIDITGKSRLQESFVNTGGILSAAKFECKEVFIKMNTGGNADVFATKKIDARVNTGASLSVYGKAKQEVLKTSLGGEIIRWNE
ncbi:MAG TPA: head GIN domain-containing protein [Bacteroidales bacterium]|nr:head GIN domain-containing protein [Bacteroidales bacterium]